MSYESSYTITSSIVSLVADISEWMGYLSALESESRTLYLRRINRIRTIQGSLAIEGKSCHRMSDPPSHPPSHPPSRTPAGDAGWRYVPRPITKCYWPARPQVVPRALSCTGIGGRIDRDD